MSANRQRWFDLIRDFVKVPGMWLAGRCSQDSTVVLMLNGLVVLILAAMDISQSSTEGMQHCFRGARVPLLASRTCKDVRMCFAFYQQKDLHRTADNTSVSRLNCMQFPNPWVALIPRCSFKLTFTSLFQHRWSNIYLLPQNTHNLKLNLDLQMLNKI